MRRRDLLTVLGGTAGGWPLLVRAEQKTMPVVGILTSGSIAPDPALRIRGPVHQDLRETGYIDGENYTVEYRAADGHYELLPALAADLVARKVDVIVAEGTPSALAAKAATSTIPVVFMGVGDPLAAGLVTSLARPSGNLTGVSILSVELMSKRFELISELVPQTGLAALLVNPNYSNTRRVIGDAQEAARARGLQLLILEASTESEIDDAFPLIVEAHAGLLIVSTDPFLNSRPKQLATLASRCGVAAICDFRQFVADGGLISYGVDPQANNRHAGIYAGRILKGAKPADLPVEQPTKFSLIINLKTAKALGLTVPQTLLARADEVIE
jgi:putative ABC transport system substrate-binding protein